MWELEQLQSLPLEIKIRKSQSRIREWYENWGGQVYVSFSGGKDSTVLLDIARRIYPNIKAVFVDTGLEYPEIKQFVNTVDNVEIIRPKMNFKQVIEHYGYPVISKEVANTVRLAKPTPGNTRWQRLHGELINPQNGKKSAYNCEKYKYLLDAPFKISEQCCDVMKKRPGALYQKETGMKPILGLMTCESRKRKMAWLKTGCNAFNSKSPQSQPMAFWTEQDVLEYLQKYKIPYASVYGDIVKDENGNLTTTGCHRTGCVFCLFGIHMEHEPNRIQQLKETHPQLYDYCINQLDLKQVLEYIDIPYK